MTIAREKRFRCGVLVAFLPALGFVGCLALNATDPAYQVAAGPAEADLTTMNDTEVLETTIKDFTSPDFSELSIVLIGGGMVIAASSLTTDDRAEESK